MTTLPKLGLHPRTPERVYRAWPAANYSSLKEFRYTPQHAYQALTNPSDTTKAMALGTATHFAVLEPELFETRYVRGAAGDLVRKGPRDENKEIIANNPNKEVVRDKDWPKILRMRDAVWAHPRAADLLSGEGFNEIAGLWEDPGTGLACKFRVDRLGQSGEWPCVVDFKTFGDFGGKLTERAVELAIHRYQYHVQGAHYLDGFNAIEPFQRRYILIFAEKEPPFAVRCVEIDFAALELGRRLIRKWLRQLKRCQDTGVWPGWSTDFDPIGLPHWVYNQESDEEEDE